MNEQEIMDRLGKDWEWIDCEFARMSANEIEERLDLMYPDDDNYRLARAIYYELEGDI